MLFSISTWFLTHCNTDRKSLYPIFYEPMHHSLPNFLVGESRQHTYNVVCDHETRVKLFSVGQDDLNSRCQMSYSSHNAVVAFNVFYMTTNSKISTWTVPICLGKRDMIKLQSATACPNEKKRWVRVPAACFIHFVVIQNSRRKKRPNKN